jgi:choline dehydrogenase
VNARDLHSDRRPDILILGGGTAGCVLAARLSEDPSRTVCLVEAGPDYGPLSDGRWPADLLDGRTLALSHDWDFNGDDPKAARARVIGGCSAHNACFIAWGAPGDYDEWIPFGGPEWGWNDFASDLHAAESALRTRRPEDAERSGLTASLLAAAASAGLPYIEDFNRPESILGMSRIPVNAVGHVRWNTAFAYLDAARQRPNLEILADTLVDRVVLDGDRAVGAIVRRDGAEVTLSAEQVIVAAGTYGSPAILLRSGIGPAAHLRELGIRPLVDRPGVGANLRDHPGVWLQFRLQAEAAVQVRRAEPDTGMEVLLGKARSSRCPVGTHDLHVLAYTDSVSGGPADERLLALVSWNMKPASTGQVELLSPDPTVLPRIDHGFLSDPDGRDLDVLLDAVALLREVAAAEPLRQAVGSPIDLSSEIQGGELREWIRENVSGYWHPVGTCAMGQPNDPMAVVDGHGRVHGISRLVVADASVMPTIPRANTNLTTVAIAEVLAKRLSERLGDR